MCFWCGQAKNEIALLGRISRKKEVRTAWGGTSSVVESDIEAPHYAVIDYAPCDKCKERMSQGFTVMEVALEPNLRSEVEMQPGIYPTGRYVVVKSDAAKNIFPSEYLSRGKCFMGCDDFIKMFGEVVDK